MCNGYGKRRHKTTQAAVQQTQKSVAKSKRSFVVPGIGGGAAGRKK